MPKITGLFLIATILTSCNPAVAQTVPLETQTMQAATWEPTTTPLIIPTEVASAVGFPIDITVPPSKPETILLPGALLETNQEMLLPYFERAKTGGWFLEISPPAQELFNQNSDNAALENGIRDLDVLTQAIEQSDKQGGRLIVNHVADQIRAFYEHERRFYTWEPQYNNPDQPVGIAGYDLTETVALLSEIPIGHVLIRIESGNTLYQLSQAFNTSVALLQAINNIDDPRNLQANQVLLVPINGGVGGLESQIVAQSAIEVPRSPEIPGYRLTSEGWYSIKTGRLVDPQVESLFLALSASGQLDLLGQPITPILDVVYLTEAWKQQIFEKAVLEITPAGQLRIAELGSYGCSLQELGGRFDLPSSQSLQYDRQALETWRISHPGEWQSLSDEAIRLLHQPETANSQYQTLLYTAHQEVPLTYDRVMLILYSYRVGIEQNTRLVELVEGIKPGLAALQVLMDEKLDPADFQNGSVPQLPQDNLMDRYLFIYDPNMWNQGLSFRDKIIIYGSWHDLDSFESKSWLPRYVDYTAAHEEIHTTFQANLAVPHDEGVTSQAWEFSHRLFDLPISLAFNYQPQGFCILLLDRLETAGYDDPLGMIVRAAVNPREGERLLGIYDQIRQPGDPDPADPNFFRELSRVSISEVSWHSWQQRLGE